MINAEAAWNRPPDMPPGQVSICRVWLCPSAVVADIVIDGDLVEEHREPVARHLRVVGDAAAQVGHPAPVLGLLRPSPPPEDAEEAREWQYRQESVAEQWNTDQDWNRGDFIVEVVSSEEDARRRAEVLARPLSPTSLEAAPVGGTRTLDDLTRNLDELADRQADDATKTLLSQVAEGLRSGDVGGSIGRWAEEWIEAARRAAAQAQEQEEAEEELVPREDAEFEVSHD